MAKRATKPTKKKREQPWMEAAREKLRSKGRAREDHEISHAFTAVATPVIDALHEDPSKEELFAVLDLVRVAWNLPLVHLLSTEPGSEGALIRADIERRLMSPERRRALVPLCHARVRDFAHLDRPILQVVAKTAEDEMNIELRIGARGAVEGELLDVGDDGWPLASQSLLHLSGLLRALFPSGLTDADAKGAIGLTALAWNIPVLDRADDRVAPASLRDKMREAALRTNDLSPALRAAFDAMVLARSTRFAHDPRVMVGAEAWVEGTTMQVKAAGAWVEAASG